MSQNKKVSPIERAVLYGLFLVIVIAIVYFLFSAPEEKTPTTPNLPHDANHESLHAIKSKEEAEKHCLSCHFPEKSSPLPANHPPEHRCLFCHKRD